MAHGITRSDRPAYAGVGAWHGLGTVVEGIHDLDTMIDAAHLRDYRVELAPVSATTPDGRFIPVPDYRAVRRVDTGAILSVVTDSYEPYQYAEGAEFLRSLMADGIIDVESTGTLFAGRRWWILANIPAETYTVAGDLHKTFMLIDSSHDGSHAVTARNTCVRVVCGNTLGAAHAEASKRGQDAFRILHTANMRDRLAVAQSALQFVTAQQLRLAEFLARAAVTPATSGDCARLGVALFGPIEERGARVKNNVARFASIVREERARNDNTLTAYTLVNGITGYADHQRSASPARTLEQREKRFVSSFDGGGDAFKAQGLAFIRELVG